MDAEEVKAWLARDKNKKKDTRRINLGLIEVTGAPRTSAKGEGSGLGKRKGQPSGKPSKKKASVLGYSKDRFGPEQTRKSKDTTSKKSYKRVTDPFMGRGTGPGPKTVLVEDRPIKKRPKRKMVNPARGFSHGGRPTGQGFGVARFNRGGPAKNRVPY
jgi:hypothetical protein